MFGCTGKVSRTGLVPRLASRQSPMSSHKKQKATPSRGGVSAATAAGSAAASAAAAGGIAAAARPVQSAAPGAQLPQKQKQPQTKGGKAPVAASPFAPKKNAVPTAAVVDDDDLDDIFSGKKKPPKAAAAPSTSRSARTAFTHTFSQRASFLSHPLHAPDDPLHVSRTLRAPWWPLYRRGRPQKAANPRGTATHADTVDTTRNTDAFTQHILHIIHTACDVFSTCH
jgi:hypothetical protein